MILSFCFCLTVSTGNQKQLRDPISLCTQKDSARISYKLIIGSNIHITKLKRSVSGPYLVKNLPKNVITTTTALIIL